MVAPSAVLGHHVEVSVKGCRLIVVGRCVEHRIALTSRPAHVSYDFGAKLSVFLGGFVHLPRQGVKLAIPVSRHALTSTFRDAETKPKPLHRCFQAFFLRIYLNGQRMVILALGHMGYELSQGDRSIVVDIHRLEQVRDVLGLHAQMLGQTVDVVKLLAAQLLIATLVKHNKLGQELVVGLLADTCLHPWLIHPRPLLWGRHNGRLLHIGPAAATAHRSVSLPGRRPSRNSLRAEAKMA
mmetsp:Transcript_94613/g.304494  ORF Transcript_94613/g.304494 Transcript_94613/m.304494 type:complete len:239 (-) Transcript_94613:3-719(-)